MSPRCRGRAHRVAGDWAEFDLVGDAPDPFVPERLLDRLGLDPAVPFERGDLLVVGRAFGAGTSTDRAALAFALAGVGGLLAHSLHAGLRDACLHAGVPVLAMPGLPELFREGEDVIVDFRSGTVENVTTHKVTVAPALSPTDVRILREAPSLAWYGLRPARADPDVVESTGPAPPKGPTPVPPSPTPAPHRPLF